LRKTAKPLKFNLLRSLTVWLGRLFLLLILIPTLQVVLLRWVDPPFTLTILDRATSSNPMRWPVQQHRPLHELGYTPRAAVAAEDGHFFQHHGFDWEGICKAAHSKRLRGGSTISQQVARNVFLWQERSWLRKGLEVGYTVLLELLLPKTRILEVYLNVAETGPMRFGVEAAAQQEFHESAAQLSPEQAGRIIAIFPSPRKWRVGDDRATKKAAWILENPVPFPGEAGYEQAMQQYQKTAPWPWDCWIKL
jgi:monofunctional biosynthetic peptidoglycan transglycosylase